jgi:enoyl-CoA hydratase
MTYENIAVLEQDRIIEITIQRPAALNALNTATVAELRAAFEGLTRHDCGVVILTGAGDKAFVAGADIAEMATMSRGEAHLFATSGHALMHAIEALPLPVIAAVNGFALGGGCELALACDFIYASSRAQFGQPEVALGVIPGFGGTQRLGRRIGAARARELIYTGRRLAAEDALRMGLVNSVFEPAELLPQTRETARKILEQGPLAIMAAKRAIALDPQGVLVANNASEADMFADLFRTADQQEGMNAFLAKRKPTWTSR